MARKRTLTMPSRLATFWHCLLLCILLSGALFFIFAMKPPASASVLVEKFQRHGSIGSNFISNAEQLHRPKAGQLDSRWGKIPRILHFTFASEHVYSNYRDFVSRCLALNPDWQVYLWRDADGERLIKDHYPSFTAKFSSYGGDLQKSDAVRYAVLHRFGGVYLDMDVECLQPLFPTLQNYAAFVDRDRWEQTILLYNKPLALMNSAMGSAPGHPFFLYVLNKMKSLHGNSPVFTTGPMALTKIYQDWLNSNEAKNASAVTVLPSQVFSGLVDQNNPAVLSPCHRLPPEYGSRAPSPAERQRLAAELSGFDIDRPETHRGRDRRKMACVSLALTDWRRGLHDNLTVGVHKLLHLGYGFGASRRGPRFNLMAAFPRVRVYN